MHNSRWEFNYNISADCPQESICVYFNFGGGSLVLQNGFSDSYDTKRIKDSGSFKLILMIVLILLTTSSKLEGQ